MPKDTQDEPIDMDADSSAAPALDEANTDTAPAAEVEAPAESSAATDETEADTLSVVRDVVEAREEEQAEAAPSAEGEETGEEAEAAGEQDDENYSDVPFNSHPRFRKLLAERNTFKADAVRYQNVESFLDQNNVTAAEAADVMTIAGLAKTNPVKAWEMAKTWVQQLLIGAGEVLPQDLAQRVANKELSQDVALELSRTRAAQASQEAVRQFQEQRGQRQQQVQQGTLLRDTAEQWVTQRRLKDPNFTAKEPRVVERLAWLQRTEGVPNTPDGVKAQLKKAYEHVNKTTTAPVAKPATAAAVTAAPRTKPAIRPITAGQVAASGAQPAPKTTLEVIRQIRQRA